MKMLRLISALLFLASSSSNAAAAPLLALKKSGFVSGKSKTDFHLRASEKAVTVLGGWFRGFMQTPLKKECAATCAKFAAPMDGALDAFVNACASILPLPSDAADAESAFATRSRTLTLFGQEHKSEKGVINCMESLLGFSYNATKILLEAAPSLELNCASQVLDVGLKMDRLFTRYNPVLNTTAFLTHLKEDIVQNLGPISGNIGDAAKQMGRIVTNRADEKAASSARSTR